MGEVHQWLSTSDNEAIIVAKSCQRKDTSEKTGESRTFFVQDNIETSSQSAILSVSCAPVFYEFQEPFGINLSFTRVDFIDKTISPSFSLISRIERPPKA